MQKYLPMAFFNAQEHYLIRQVEEIELCGPIHTSSMWMVERHLKSLKDLIKQRKHLEHCMMEGYMVYKSMVHISQYLPKLAANMHVDCIWDVNYIKVFEREHLLGKGRMRKVKGYMVEIYNTYDFSILCVLYLFNFYSFINY